MSTIQKIRVAQMTSTKSYRPAANQFIIETPEGRYFQSYRTIIAFWDNDGNVTLDKDSWDYSRTTSKYRGRFLGENTDETRKKIKRGEYLLADLN